MNRPDLLYITPTIPNPTGNGLSMRAYNVLKALSSKYSIYLLVIDTFPSNQSLNRAVSEMCHRVVNVPIDPVKNFWLTTRSLANKITNRFFNRHTSHPLEWTFITRRRLKSISQIFKGINFDVIHIYRLYMIPYANLFIDKSFSGVFQLDLDDIESLTRWRLSELYKLNGNSAMALEMASEAKKYEDIERRVLPLLDRIFVCSTVDRERICQGYHCKQIDVIPNVIQFPKIDINEAVSTPFTFLFVGSLRYYPNIDGIFYFCDKILPLLRKGSQIEFAINIVGDGISKKHAKKLSLINEVNLIGRVQDVGPYYKNSHSALIPLRTGGGSRIKALEAFAYRKPVVSTSIGIEGIHIQHEKHVLIADTARMFAQNCIRIMSDPVLRKSLSENAFYHVKKFHNLQIIIENLCGKE